MPLIRLVSGGSPRVVGAECARWKMGSLNQFGPHCDTMASCNYCFCSGSSAALASTEVGAAASEIGSLVAGRAPTRFSPAPWRKSRQAKAAQALWTTRSATATVGSKAIVQAAQRSPRAIVLDPISTTRLRPAIANEVGCTTGSSASSAISRTAGWPAGLLFRSQPREQKPLVMRVH